ncbi:acyl carrier protein [Cellulosimicrobium sp. MI9406]|uniref:acyl carrier protein n=1 Tax=unclassified Cellulosimicrobium TaxID=2624466 RepID=UPI0005DA70B5|nr:acyl carrier protein [Cellulosimicrobium sp. JZ28]CPU66432.1 acyl carrier protein [Mycobacteroides abscessus]
MSTSTEPQEALGRERVVGAVVEALSSVLGRPLPDVTSTTRLFDDLDLDSTSVLGLLMALEDSLDMEVDPESLEQHHLETVGSLTDFVVEHSTRN